MKLQRALDDYLLWMIEQGYSHSTWRIYEGVLKHFLMFVNRHEIPWDNVFTFTTELRFRKETGLYAISAAVRGLSRYLYRQNRIVRPIEKPIKELPRIYAQYVQDYQDSRQIQLSQLRKIRSTLSALNEDLTKNKIGIKEIKIEHLDAFLTRRGKGLALLSRQKEVSRVRGFLTYLYERKLLRKNLAPLLVSAPQFARSNPPRFLRPWEIKNLLATLDLQSSLDLRTNAMIHLAYSLGLRPKEISLIHLDDICFTTGDISIRRRKNDNPIQLPLGENTLKAIAAYMVGSRPKNSHRSLLLQNKAPYGTVSPATVCHDIAACMRKAKVKGSAYGLRHSYAQTLLEQGVSIFEIKNMMGHDRIQTTKRYLHIDIKLMRETLFDETV